MGEQGGQASVDDGVCSNMFKIMTHMAQSQCQV
jgi:hypothetical protein